MTKTIILSTVMVGALTFNAQAAKPVGIVKGVMEVAGISRAQDSKNTINPAFAKT
jgi:hypothetical protein